jgi:hypothetical protein
MEYFFDTDPGFGNGTPIAVVDGTITSTAFDIDISGLSTGFHKVYFRIKNENEVWSLNYIQNMVKVAEEAIPTSTDIVTMEYFYDTDPGFGNGTAVPITPDTVTNTAFDIDVSGLDAGHHKVYVRTKNENEVWSNNLQQNISYPFHVKHFERYYSMGSDGSELELARPFDYDELLQNREFKSINTEIISNRKWNIRGLKKLIQDIELLIQDIEVFLNNKGASV